MFHYLPDYVQKHNPVCTNTTLTPDEFLEHALYVPNPLLSALFGLATGHTKMDIDQKVSKFSWPDYQSQLLSLPTHGK
jgi:hypothetical protein